MFPLARRSARTAPGTTPAWRPASTTKRPLGDEKPGQPRDSRLGAAGRADGHGVRATPAALDSSVTARRHNGGHARSTETPPPPEDFEENIVDIDVAEEMRGSYLEYAYSVIYQRALP